MGTEVMSRPQYNNGDHVGLMMDGDGHAKNI